MLVVDTATPAVTAAVVRVRPDAVEAVSERVAGSSAAAVTAGVAVSTTSTGRAASGTRRG